jgi:DNA-binding response OmpR family regulator
MPQVTEPPSMVRTIMVVDDSPANLKLLEDLLRQESYEVIAFPRGRLALAAAAQTPPDLILLDINMPEMSGYEVCQHLKETPRLASIPVIFLSALDSTEDKVKGFQAGGVDYISKPFQFEEVHARVRTHLRLQRALAAERDLLEKTLRGAVETLWQLVQGASPSLALRSNSVRAITRWMTRNRDLQDPWQYDLASTLCLIGCLAVPNEVFEKAYKGHDLLSEEERMFRAHPNRAFRLLSKIPRLNGIAEMIRGQQRPEEAAYSTEQAKEGARMLHLALELDRRIYRGDAAAAALVALRYSGKFESSLLDALEGYSPPDAEFEVGRLPIRDLRPGMILENDVLSNQGTLILQKGTLLGETWIERLENFSKSVSAQRAFDVRIPKLAGHIPTINVRF